MTVLVWDGTSLATDRQANDVERRRAEEMDTDDEEDEEEEDDE